LGELLVVDLYVPPAMHKGIALLFQAEFYIFRYPKIYLFYRLYGEPDVRIN